MAVTFTWEFPQLDVVYSEGDLSNVVQAVHWKYTATEGNYSDYMFGCTPLDPPSGQFINYSDLTPEIVTGWVTGKLGTEKVDEMNAELDARIQALKAPKGGTEPPPWAPAPVLISE